SDLIRNGDTYMNRINASKSDRAGLSACRLALFASAAGLAIAVVAAGPSSYGALSLLSWTTSAQAAGAVQPPTGFADIVTKVKPAVISVLVKIDESAKMTGMNGRDEGNTSPLQPGAPMEKFFKQFGFPGMPNETPQGKQTVTGEGS